MNTSLCEKFYAGLEEFTSLQFHITSNCDHFTAQHLTMENENEIEKVLTSLSKYDLKHSVSLSSVTEHLPLMCVAGNVSTCLERKSSLCFNWCRVFSDKSSS